MKDIEFKTGDVEKVLVVEDNESCFILIKEYLRIADTECVRAKNSLEVIEILQKKEVSLALVDLCLSTQETGIDIMKRIKTINPDLPVIIQTANASAENRDNCFMEGCDDYLVKPYSFDTFLSIILKFSHAKSA